MRLAQGAVGYWETGAVIGDAASSTLSAEAGPTSAWVSRSYNCARPLVLWIACLTPDVVHLQDLEGLSGQHEFDFDLNDDDVAGMALSQLSQSSQERREAGKRDSDGGYASEADVCSPAKMARAHDGSATPAVAVAVAAAAGASAIAVPAVVAAPADIVHARAQRFSTLMTAHSAAPKDAGVSDFAANCLFAQTEDSIVGLRLPWPSGSKKERHVPGIVSELLYAYYFLTRDAAGEPVAPCRAFVAGVRATFKLPGGTDKRLPFTRSVNVTAASLGPLLDFMCPFGDRVSREDLDELLTTIASSDSQRRLNTIKGVGFKQGCVLPRQAFDLVKGWRDDRAPVSTTKAKGASPFLSAGDDARIDQVVKPSAVVLRMALPGCLLSDVLVTRKDAMLLIYVGAHVETLKANLSKRMEWSAAVEALPANVVRPEVSAFAEALNDTEQKPPSFYRFTGKFSVPLNVKSERLQKERPAVSLMNGVLTITLAFQDKENANTHYYF